MTVSLHQYADGLLICSQLSLSSCAKRVPKFKDVDVDPVHMGYAFSDHKISLNSKEISDILIELSSPLMGYLGRDEKCYRFYFLRDLMV